MFKNVRTGKHREDDRRYLPINMQQNKSFISGDGSITMVYCPWQFVQQVYISTVVHITVVYSPPWSITNGNSPGVL